MEYFTIYVINFYHPFSDNDISDDNFCGHMAEHE